MERALKEKAIEEEMERASKEKAIEEEMERASKEKATESKEKEEAIKSKAKEGSTSSSSPKSSPPQHFPPEGECVLNEEDKEIPEQDDEVLEQDGEEILNLNGEDAIQQFMDTHYPMLIFPQNIKETIRGYLGILRNISFAGVNDDLVMGVLIYISSLDRDSPYTFKELRLKNIKDSKFCSMKNKIVKVLNENGIKIEDKSIKPIQLLRRYARQFGLTNEGRDRIFTAADNTETLGLSEHPDSIAAALLVLGTETKIPPITMQQVSNATNVNIGTRRRVKKMLHDLHRGSLFPEDGAGAEVAGAEAEVAGAETEVQVGAGAGEKEGAGEEEH
ncbi:hypothetical protein CKAN_01016700 [Cinnamomum micranthum f. kanehirae]|uniref:Uncharacterized protein n=1 Tax=Cinnamomum micranthum f. kanehirae TaxID=337451 RepID=A0A3S3N5Z9_9MAGN|nr:hypothetical protein CKAN_01016700 [Cinnamomum micranthum f. kanehirae]